MSSNQTKQGTNARTNAMRGHTTTGRRESDEVAAIPHIQRNGSRGGGSGEESGRRDGFEPNEDEVGNRLEGGEHLRSGIIGSRGGDDRRGR